MSAFERTFSSAMSSIRPDSIVIVGAVLNVLLIGLKFGTSLYCESAALLAEVRGKTNQYVCKQYKSPDHPIRTLNKLSNGRRA